LHALFPTAIVKLLTFPNLPLSPYRSGIRRGKFNLNSASQVVQISVSHRSISGGPSLFFFLILFFYFFYFFYFYYFFIYLIFNLFF